MFDADGEDSRAAGVDGSPDDDGLTHAGVVYVFALRPVSQRLPSLQGWALVPLAALFSATAGLAVRRRAPPARPGG